MSADAAMYQVYQKSIDIELFGEQRREYKTKISNEVEKAWQ